MISATDKFSVVEVAMRKAPLIKPALRRLQHIDWAHSAVTATDDASCTRAALLAIILVGRGALLGQASDAEHQKIVDDIDAILDDHVGTSAREFPSLELEEFESELRESLAAIRATAPTLDFPDLFHAALGDRICAWAGIARSESWDTTRWALLRMTVGRACSDAARALSLRARDA